MLKFAVLDKFIDIFKKDKIGSLSQNKCDAGSKAGNQKALVVDREISRNVRVAG